MASYTVTDILRTLDHAHTAIDMPCYTNMNIDYLTSQLIAFRDDHHWALVFNSVVWWPAATGLSTMIECVGNCICGKQGFQDDPLVHPATLHVSADDPPQLQALTIRGIDVPVDSLTIAPSYAQHPDFEFWVALAMLPIYRADPLASPAEYRQCLPDSMPQFLTLDAWYHPDVLELPSQTDTFQLLAQVLVSGDRTQYQPTSKPNTYWHIWLDKR